MGKFERKMNKKLLESFAASMNKISHEACDRLNLKNISKRFTLKSKIMWSEGGYGFGICSVATSMMWSMQKPKKPEDDWPSVVAVHGPHLKYTIEELEKLVAFSERRTARYDEMFEWRMGANLIVIDKYDSGSWLRKRMSWTMGPMYSETLDEAMAVFEEKGY